MVLLVDQNTSWLATKLTAEAAWEAHGWEVISVANPLSGLHTRSSDEDIYRTAAKNSWGVVTRNRKDFVAIARVAAARGEPMTEVFVIWDEVADCDEVICAIAASLASTPRGDAAAFKVSDLSQFFSADYAGYLGALRRINVARATGMSQAVADQQAVAHYEKKRELAPAQTLPAGKTRRARSVLRKTMTDLLISEEKKKMPRRRKRQRRTAKE